MALTVVTSPNPGNLDTTKSIGSLYELTARFTSDKVSIVGDTIQVNLALFGNKAQPDPTAQNQTYAYTCIMPGSPITVIMNPLVTLDPTRWVYAMYLDYIDDVTFDITVKFVMNMDWRNFWNSNVTNNAWRFEKNVQNNPLTDDNTLPSVYNQEKQIQIEATDWDGSTAENAVYRQTVHSRFWCNIGGDCCDLFAGCIIPNAIDNWAYQLYDENGLLTSGLSAFNTRNIKFQAEFVAGTTPSKYYVGVYRKDVATNAAEYWVDLEYCHAEFDPTMTGISGSPFSTAAFAAGGAAMTNLSGDLWEADIEFDPSYFTFGATYRVFIVVEDNLNDQYSCMTADIQASGCPDVTYGDIDLEIYQYDSASTLYTDDYLINVATRGRIRFDCILDKASYNTAIIANGLAGDFDTNFTGYGNLVLDYLPTNTVLQNDYNIPVTFTNNNANDITIRSEFQIPEDWSGQLKYLIFLFSFDITIGAATYTDQLQKVIKLNVRVNDEDEGTPVFTPTIVDQDSNPIALDDKLCADSVEEITITFSEGEPNDFDFIQVTREGTTGDYDENDEYTNTELSQESNPVIQSADADTAGGDGDMTVSMNSLSLNTPIKIGGVFIDQVAPTPPVCGNIAYDGTLEFIYNTDYETRCDYNFNLTPLVDADVAQVVVNFNANGQGWTNNTYVNEAISSSPTVILLPSFTPVAIVDFDIFITLTDGCQYQVTYTETLHLTLPGVTANYNDPAVPPI